MVVQGNSMCVPRDSLETGQVRTGMPRIPLGSPKDTVGVKMCLLKQPRDSAGTRQM